MMPTATRPMVVAIHASAAGVRSAPDLAERIDITAPTSSELYAATISESPKIPVTDAICSNPRLFAATYPSKFQGKPISGRCVRKNSSATHKKGAAANAYPSPALEVHATSAAKAAQNTDAANESSSSSPAASQAGTGP